MEGLDVTCALRWPGCSSGIFLEHFGAWRQVNPRMPTAVVYGVSRRWEAGVSKRPNGNGNGNGVTVTFLGMEDGSPADRAEPKPELCSLISGTNVPVAVPKTLKGAEKLASAAKTLPVLC